jgi:hypothetical protein
MYGASLVAMAVCAYLMTHATERSVVNLTVTPSVSFAPATIAPKIHVTPSATNRLLRYSLDGMEFSQVSDIALNGDNAPATFWPTPWKSVPAGEYEARVTVYDVYGAVVGSARTKVQVVAVGERE